ncbi:6-phospho-beta-glucosidase [Paenibacillus faecis]|uniref:6-phospho-beta-glucosidase n=1 Tax=Paenibacillus faecis TaxID=862114 RepID=A0A5D0CQH3_9BACL|nr:6-phospho-beta-glucosidase [Paenibacillus faecis]TYA12209.1 6-phospho-beta-glucosidase [Paenibacillus faecis]
MKETLKLVVVGAGSSYTPELIEGVIMHHKELPVGEIWLVDIEEGVEKLHTIAELSKRMIAQSGLPITVCETLDRRKAIAGADFVCTQIRVGMLEARKWDELIPLKYNVIGQETTGPGGMMKGLRTIPVILDICRDIEELAPDAWLLNFTNPAGMVTEAVHKYASVKSVGLCNSPIGFQKWLSEFFELPIEKIYAEFVGINHLHWVSDVVIDGVSRLQELIDYPKSYKASNVPFDAWDHRFLNSLKAIPSYYLSYYYMTDAMLDEQKEAAATTGSRAEVVKQVEEELFELYRNVELKEKPKQLEQRGGAYYSEAAVLLMRSIYNDSRDIQTLNVRNGRTIDFLPEDASIEVNCIVTKQGPLPIPPQKIPESVKGLLAAVKQYESLTIEAAVHGDRDTALQAMVHHPLVPSVTVAEQLLDEMLEKNKPYLPKFH